MSIRIAAVADIHSPRYLNLFVLSMKKIDFNTIDLFILAGDIINKGRFGECRHVVDVIGRYFKGPIIGVYGNEEYDEIKDSLRKVCSKIIWLDDNSIVLDVGDTKLGIVGTRGSLDKPTIWQRRNIPNIVEVYNKRIDKIKHLLSEIRNKAKYTMLVSHYSLVCNTLVGEKRSIWPFLSSSKLTRVIEELKPTLVVHGHTHRSRVYFAYIGSTKVFNVALPATNKISIITL